MTRYSPGSVRTTARGWLSHYRALQLTERILYTAWSAAVLATLLGLAGVSAYHVAASQPQRENCSVSLVSPIYATVASSHYRVIVTSCGRYTIHPGDRATSALEPARDALAITGSPSERRYVLTFHGWGSDRTLVRAMSH